VYSAGSLRRKGLRAGDPDVVLSDRADEMMEEIPEHWSPDGRTLLFLRRDPNTERQSVWALSPDEGVEPELLMDTGFRVDEPRISPDGRWLAYISDESGQYEVYVEPYRREGERVRVSLRGGGQPRWRGDGKELFFVAQENDLMAVALQETGDRLEVSLPEELLRLGVSVGPMLDDYAVTADGERFLVKKPLEQAQLPRVHVLLNWPTILERRGRGPGGPPRRGPE
jgi:dipeptidyl aminopeptidase/acylaminoacyl peptidase